MDGSPQRYPAGGPHRPENGRVKNCLFPADAVSKTGFPVRTDTQNQGWLRFPNLGRCGRWTPATAIFAFGDHRRRVMPDAHLPVLAKFVNSRFETSNSFVIIFQEENRLHPNAPTAAECGETDGNEGQRQNQSRGSRDYKTLSHMRQSFVNSL